KSTMKEESLNRGRIKGTFNCYKTIQARNNINSNEKTIFICNENYRNFDTRENLVLKTFLKILYDTFNEQRMYKYYDRNWFNEGPKIKSKLEKIYLKNIYISRVDLKKLILDDRYIDSVCRSRNKLYKEAAKLLKYYKKIISLDPVEIRKLLNNTFIELASEDTLFELYWILKIIKDNTSDATMYLLDDNNNKVAEWEKGQNIYSIYHNSSGSDELSFSVHVDEIREIKNPYIERKIQAIDESNILSKKLFENVEDRGQYVVKGRPDIIIEIRNKSTRELKEVILGEVKHTIKKEYALDGLDELLEYMKLIKIKSKYNYNYNYNYINDKPCVKGMLFLDNIQVNSLKEENLKVITMENRKSKINI
ncbi:MAG: hypothetical protein AAGU01_04155, partial [Clostridiaceae bacterium]